MVASDLPVQQFFLCIMFICGNWWCLCDAARSTHTALIVAALSCLALSMLNNALIYQTTRLNKHCLSIASVQITDISIAQLSILSDDLAMLKMSPLSHTPKHQAARCRRSAHPSALCLTFNQFIVHLPQDLQRSPSHFLLKEQSIEIGFERRTSSKREAASSSFVFNSQQYEAPK